MNTTTLTQELTTSDALWDCWLTCLFRRMWCVCRPRSRTCVVSSRRRWRPKRNAIDHNEMTLPNCQRPSSVTRWKNWNRIVLVTYRYSPNSSTMHWKRFSIDRMLANILTCWLVQFCFHLIAPCGLVSTVSQKRDLCTFACNFGKYQPIFQTFSLFNSAIHLQQGIHYIAHHTLTVLLHYFAK